MKVTILLRLCEGLFLWGWLYWYLFYFVIGVRWEWRVINWVRLVVVVYILRVLVLSYLRLWSERMRRYLCCLFWWPNGRHYSRTNKVSWLKNYFLILLSSIATISSLSLFPTWISLRFIRDLMILLHLLTLQGTIRSTRSVLWLIRCLY
jgi:hypothetical protein